jgi:hypothetical protein
MEREEMGRPKGSKNGARKRGPILGAKRDGYINARLHKLTTERLTALCYLYSKPVFEILDMAIEMMTLAANGAVEKLMELKGYKPTPQSEQQQLQEPKEGG